jgi:hypothetical protein
MAGAASNPTGQQYPPDLRLVHADSLGCACASHISAVLFCATQTEGTILEPVVPPGEVRGYIGGVEVG